jgi:hypothetical protein
VDDAGQSRDRAKPAANSRANSTVREKPPADKATTSATTIGANAMTALKCSICDEGGLPALAGNTQQKSRRESRKRILAHPPGELVERHPRLPSGLYGIGDTFGRCLGAWPYCSSRDRSLRQGDAACQYDRL